MVRLLDQGLDFFDELLGLEGSAPMKTQFEVLRAVGDQPLRRFQETWHALPGIEITEISEDGPTPIHRWTMWRRLCNRTTIRQNLDDVGRQAPGDEAILDESARRNEAINLAKQCLEKALAKEEPVGGNGRGSSCCSGPGLPGRSALAPSYASSDHRGRRWHNSHAES